MAGTANWTGEALIEVMWCRERKQHDGDHYSYLVIKAKVGCLPPALPPTITPFFRLCQRERRVIEQDKEEICY